MGKLGFTPLIGLAVVVALALAAVFGAMSLTNPAFAAIGQPADAELAERTFSPQAAPTGVSASAVPGGADLGWPATSTATGWVVNISTGGGQPVSIRVNDNTEVFSGIYSATLNNSSPDAATGVDVRGLINETEYCFTVQYVTTGGASPTSDSMCVTPGAAPSGTPTQPTATGGAGSVKLVWTWEDPNDGTPAASSWEYQQESGAWKELPDVSSDGNEREATVEGLDADTGQTFAVRAVSARGVSGTASSSSSAVDITVGATFEAQSKKPRSNTRYDISIPISLNTTHSDGSTIDLEVFSTLTDDIVVELEDYSVPSSISESSVAVSRDRSGTILNTIADTVSVSGEKIAITIGDWNKDRTGGNQTGDTTVNNEDVITIVLKQSAGIKNPSKAGDYGPAIEVKATHDPSNKLIDINMTDRHTIQRIVKLSEEDGGLGDDVTATASGFEKNVTLHFFLDGDEGRAPNGKLDLGEDILCSVQKTSGDNVGSCDFKVATPTFSRGKNYVNAVDGDGNTGTHMMHDDQTFALKASISATPPGGSPGEIMQVQLVSFPANAPIQVIKLSGSYICGGVSPDDTESNCSSVYGSVGSMGNGNIGVTVPNWAVGGVQELKLEAGGEDDTFNVNIVGPRILPTPQTVVANQRISLVGTGFSPGATMGDSDDGEGSKISIGGYEIPWPKVNDGRDVDVDDGGNWSASLDLPLVEATTGSGNRTLRITDSKGRTGSIGLTVAGRNFDITPESGRVGTLAVVRGMGYPSKNDEGHSFTIDVIYKVQEGPTARVSVVPDSSGRFEVQLRIPTTASIPSTNQVEVTFEHEIGNTEVLETKQHFVPEGIINLSETSGGPGTIITIDGEGFKTFVPIEQVKIGTIEITPAPKPNTDVNGMMSFDVLIPGLDVGIQTVEVRVGGTTSSTGFTVTESGLSPGHIVEVGKGLEDLGDNLVNIWHFNNDTKAWSFYDGMEGSDLTHLITGETYLVQVKSTMEVILNRDTRNLTCVGGNCWNQIVW